jgi:hypothetical protein
MVFLVLLNFARSGVEFSTYESPVSAQKDSNFGVLQIFGSRLFNLYTNRRQSHRDLRFSFKTSMYIYFQLKVIYTFFSK